MFKLAPFRRACDTCTACCDGHLIGEAYGHKFYPGRRCAFVTRNGCSINDFKPKDPCVTFLCGYKYLLDIPDWVRPDRSNVIFVQRVCEGVDYFHGNDTGRTPVPEIFAWAKAWTEKHKINMLIPRESMRKSTAQYQISIYGPDTQFRDLFIKTHPNAKLVD